MPQPAAVPDLEAKLADLETRQGKDALVLVKWWQNVNDPALVSLGGGVVTLTTAKLADIDFSDPGVLDIQFPPGTPTPSKRIARASVLNVTVMPQASVTEEVMRRFVDAS